MIKKISLFILGLVSLGLINFSSAGSYTYSGSFYFNNKVSGGNVFLSNPVPLISSYVNSDTTVSCTLSNFSSNLDGKQFTLRLYSSLYSYFDGQAAYGVHTETINIGNTYTFAYTLSNVSTYGFVCSSSVNVGSSFDYSCTVSGDNIINQSDLGGGTCDYSDYELKSDITENYCKNKFSSLMTSSECDSLYSGYVSPTLYQNCTNSLNSCSGELGVCNSSLNSCLNGNYTGNVQWSAIWINNIQHIGAGIINISIPQEIQREYYNTGDSFDLDIEGYNVDSEYIEGIIDTQSTLPNQVDLNNLVKVILPLFVPGLVIILFIYFIFRFIKKIF